MRYLADENFTNTALKQLTSEGIDIVRIPPGLRSADDWAVLRMAARDERVLVTFDKDFGELIFRRSAGSIGVVLFRLEPLSRNAVIRRICEVLRLDYNFKSVFAVVETGRIRVRHLVDVLDAGELTDEQS